MRIDVQYLQKRGKAGWRYRRKVPANLRMILGKTEIVVPVGRSEKEALKNYPKTHAETERLLEDAALRLKSAPSPDAAPMTPLELHRWATSQLRENWGLQREPTEEEEAGDPYGGGRDALADDIISKYRQDDEGHPIGLVARDAALLRALYVGDREPRPEPTLDDAKRLYLKEKVGDDKKKELQLDRVFRFVREALGRDRKLSSLRREDAKEVRDHMLDGRSAASVDRYLNVVRAVINHAMKEYDLAGLRNPFMGLEVGTKDKAEPDRDKRRPFTEEELKVTRERILTVAKADLRQIWRMLQGTGCRLAEVAGLRVEDVRLRHAIPHITVEWHDDRRIKNKVSRRNVPLIGDALEAAREAVAMATDPLLFPAYGREGGPASASAALGKHVRACVSDPKVGPTHSLRHRMKDRLRLAEVSKADQDIILGHSSGSVGEDYGGDEVRLVVSQRAMKKAFPEAG